MRDGVWWKHGCKTCIDNIHARSQPDAIGNYFRNRHRKRNSAANTKSLEIEKTANKPLAKGIQRLTADERAMSGNVSLQLPSALSSLCTVQSSLCLIRTHVVESKAISFVYHSDQTHFGTMKYLSRYPLRKGHRKF